MNTLSHVQPLRSLRKQHRGFTLIELMVVVAIIGIISAIAYPSYQESVAKSRRADGQRALIEADQFMRRYFSAKDTFVDAALPESLKVSPREGSKAYDVSISVAGTQSTYTLKLTRAGAMASDRCGDLTIDQTGKKTQSTGAAALSECFKGF